MKKHFTTAQFFVDRRHATARGPSAYRLMLAHGRLIVWLACGLLPMNGQAGEGRFWLRSGDRFEGRIKGLRDGATTLEVRHPLMADVMAIETAGLARFGVVGQPGVPLPAHWRIDLANGDRLGGRIVGLSAVGLDLETKTAGRITIPRAWLRSITRLGGAAPVLDGPGAPGDWDIFNMPTLQEAAGGGFSIPQGTISRVLPEMPDVFRLDMEIHYVGRPHWFLGFYASETGVQNPPGYVLHRSTSAFQLTIRRHDGGRGVGGINFDPGALSATVTTIDAVTMMFDRPGRTMRLFLNGESVGKLTGIEPLETFGNVVTLQVQRSIAGTELRDIRLVPLAALPPETDGQGEPGDDDGVWLADGSRLTGTVESLAGGKLRVRAADGDVEAAADDILRIDFAAGSEPVARGRGEAVVALRDGSRITLGVMEIEDGMVVGQAVATGEIRVPLADVRWIDWKGDEVDAGASATARFELRNGDVLSGVIEHWNSDERTMRFRHPHIGDPLTVALSNLNIYTVGSRVDEAESAWRVDFGAGEERLAADDLRLDDTRLTMDNRYVGKLSVSRRVDSVLFYTKDNPPLIRGVDKAGWRTNKSGPAPTFAADGSGVLLPPNSFISRALPATPEKLRIEVETQVFTQEDVVQLALAASGIGLENVTAYLLHLRANNVQLHWLQPRNAHGQPLVDGFQMPTIPLNSSHRRLLTSSMERFSTQRYTMLMDTSQRTMRVYIDGVLLADWDDVVPLANPGRFFTIRTAQQFPVRITDLLVAEWDGRLPPEVEAREERIDRDVIHLRNGDLTQADVLSIDSGKVRAKTPRLNVDIPVSRLNYLCLAGQGEPLDTWAIDTELTLTDGSLLRMEASAMTIEGGEIAGVSLHLGQVQMPLDAVRSIRWNDKTNRRGSGPTVLRTGAKPSAESSVDPPPVTIPYLENLEVDAGLDAWQAVAAHPIPENADIAPADRPEIRLAWNRSGLYVRFAVLDRNIREADNVNQLFLGSGVEIYVAPRRGSPQMIQTIIAPGFDARHNELRTLMLDYRPDQPTRPTIEMFAQRTRNGYVLTAHFPWRNLDLTVNQGDEIAVQCFVNRFEDNRMTALPWHPETGTYKDSNRMRRVILAPAPEAP